MPVKNNNRPDRGKNRKTGNAPELTADQKSELLAKQLRIKPKTKAMVDLLHSDPKLSQTEAYIRTHETTNRKAASVEAARTLAKPSVQIYSNSIVNKAKRRIGQLVDSDNENIALKASQDVIDRTEGKAGQKDGDKSRTVTVKLDLTGVKLGNHYLTTAQLDDVS
jgi:hypothetical protein